MLKFLLLRQSPPPGHINLHALFNCKDRWCVAGAILACEEVVFFQQIWIETYVVNYWVIPTFERENFKEIKYSERFSRIPSTVEDTHTNAQVGVKAKVGMHSLYTSLHVKSDKWLSLFFSTGKDYKEWEEKEGIEWEGTQNWFKCVKKKTERGRSYQSLTCFQLSKMMTLLSSSSTVTVYS